MERHIEGTSEVIPGRHDVKEKGRVVFLCLVIIVHETIVRYY